MPVVTSQNREAFIADQMRRRGGYEHSQQDEDAGFNRKMPKERSAYRNEDRDDGNLDEEYVERHDNERDRQHRLADQWHGLHTGNHQKVVKGMSHDEAMHHYHRMMGGSGEPHPEAHEALSKVLGGMYASEKREV
jgi:hypothetical protein